MNKYAGNTNCIKTMEISGSGALLFIYKLLTLTKLKAIFFKFKNNKH